jgi:hypothetical protein
MFSKASREILERGVSAIADDASKEKSKFAAVFKKVIGHPVKVVASFVTAPILVIRIAWTVKNPVRRTIAIVGLLLSLALSYVAATFLGTLAGAAFVASNIGILAGIGFFVGTTLSVYLSVIFSILVFNAVSFVFLKISAQEVVDHLNEIST